MIKLVECKKCKGMVADYAKKCPACGTEDPALPPDRIYSQSSIKPSTVANLLIGGFMLAIMLGLYSCMKESPEEEKQKIVVAAKNKKAGFHCLSALDGSHRGVVQHVKELLREPSSFEHIRTKITPVDDSGAHLLHMTYRAKNGFGGMTNGVATATVRNATCDAIVLTNN